MKRRKASNTPAPAPAIPAVAPSPAKPLRVTVDRRGRIIHGSRIVGEVALQPGGEWTLLLYPELIAGLGEKRVRYAVSVQRGVVLC